MKLSVEHTPGSTPDQWMRFIDGPLKGKQIRYPGSYPLPPTFNAPVVFEPRVYMNLDSLPELECFKVVTYYHLWALGRSYYSLELSHERAASVFLLDYLDRQFGDPDDD